MYPKQSSQISKDQERALKTIAKGAGIAFFGLLIGRFFGYLTRVFIARFLGPSNYGLISLGLALVNIVAIVSLVGMTGGLNRTIAFYLGKKNFKKVKGAIFSSFKISLPISILFSIFIFTFSKQLSIGIFSKPQLTPIIQILSFSVPFFTALFTSQSIFFGYKTIKYKVYTRDMGRNLSTLLFLIIFIFLGYGVIGATTSFLLGFVFSGTLAIFLVKTKILSQLKNIQSFPMEKELLIFSLPLFFSGLLSLVLQWTDILMLGYFNTSANVGIYRAVLDTTVLLTIFLTSFSFIFLPLISEFFSKRKISDIQKLYKTSTRWVFSITFPFFLIFVTFPDNIIKLIYGASFLPGILVFILFSITSIIVVSVGFSTNTILAIGKTKVILYLSSLAAALNFILNLILIPIYGMIGAAVALSISIILQSAVSLIYLHKKLRIQPYDKTYIKPIIASLISVILIYYVIKYILKSISPIVLILGFLTFFFFYILVFLLLRGFTKEDLLILRSLEQKTGIKIGWLRNFVKRFV